MSTRLKLQAGMVLACAALSACASTPITVSNSFTPPMGWLATRHAPPKVAPPACRIGLGAIRDTRIDPGSMGSIGYRTIRIADSTAWLRSGLLALNRDRRLVVADGTEKADIAVEVEVLKAYMMSITTSKTTAVILKLRTSRPGEQTVEQVYRGDDVGGNWNSGEGESQTAFDRALSVALLAIDRDLVARCAPAVPG